MSHATVESRLDDIERRLESLGKPRTSELDELRGKLAAAEETLKETDDYGRQLLARIRVGNEKLFSAESALAASEQAREGMASAARQAFQALNWWAARPEANRWIREGIEQDPCGTHAALAALRDALASSPAKEEAKRWHCACVHAPEQHTATDGCNVVHCPCRAQLHAGSAPVPAAPPQAETGGGPTPMMCPTCRDRGYVDNDSGSVYGGKIRRGCDCILGARYKLDGMTEQRDRMIRRFNEAEQGRDEALYTVSRLTSERDTWHRASLEMQAELDALRVQLEAAGALERPEEAWRRGYLKAGRWTQGTFTSAPYEPPTGAR